MKEFITIKNVDPLVNIDHIEIRQFTVLIGESAIGKSTLDADQTAAYRLYGGMAQNLMAKDDKGLTIVDTYDLSEMMSEIYKEYKTLTE